jgi:predicted DNA-binding transcriptional regulator YafY
MRADRLLSILMLLQSRGRMTARALAEELEVSQRTIYRDVDALSIAGIPIYGESGPEGGFALLDSYRTNLTGLSEDEVRALFMLHIPMPLDELGMGEPLRAAMRKLSACVSQLHPGDADMARQRFYIDAVWWHRRTDGGPRLRTLQEAVWQDLQVEIRYRLPPLGSEVVQLVHPYGLVAKAGRWYLVYAPADAEMVARVVQVSELVAVRCTSMAFERPTSFDLASFWQSWCARREDERTLYAVEIRIAPRLMGWLSYALGDYLVGEVEKAAADGWRRANLAFESLEEARAQLLALGGGVEVVKPRALRVSMVDYARQIIEVYA